MPTQLIGSMRSFDQAMTVEDGTELNVDLDAGFTLQVCA